MVATPDRVVPDISLLRSHFPSLASGFAYLENAGGSQVPGVVADAIRDYMLSTYVQIGAGYEKSKIATENIAEAHRFVNRIMGGEGVGQTVLGPSSTALTHILAGAYANALPAGSRIIAAETGHEANIGPWANLERRGFDFQIWRLDPATLQCPLEALEELLKPGTTKIVAFPHVSNLFGEIVDVEAITSLAHRYGAKVVVDGVAYAPHRPIAVAEWGVDWYVFSCYKVFAPHMAALFGTWEAFSEIEGPNHFFVPRDLAYKFELGGVTHEGCAGLNALGEYLKVVAGASDLTREAVVEAFERMTLLELPLQARFLEYLKSKPEVRIWGPTHAERSRVCTISFTHARLSPPVIVEQVHRHPIGIRYGNAYAYRLCQALGLDPTTGVVRASFSHYNTLDEIERLIAALDEVL